MTCRDKVAIVTGAAGKGMGRSIALTLAREGAKVAVNYRTSADSARAVVEHIQDRGGEAAAVHADVFTDEGCSKLVEAAVKAFGGADICIIGPGGGWHTEPVDQLDARAALQDVHDELAPLYLLMPLVLPGMVERGWGRIVALSLAAPYDSPAYAYNVGKAARTHAMLLGSRQTGKKGVTLNVIGPGPVDAIETLEEAVEVCDHGPAWQRRKATSPQDIAEGVAFLCSEAGRFITGCELPYR